MYDLRSQRYHDEMINLVSYPSLSYFYFFVVFLKR